MRALHIVSGPPGAGKSTIARLLAARCRRGVHLHADDFWRYVVSSFVPPWLPASAEQNAVVMSSVAAAATRFVTGGYETFVDAVVGPWFLDVFVGAGRECGVAVDFVVLRPGEEVAVQRAAARGEAGLAEEGPVRKMYRELADLGPLDRHVVDTTSLSPEETTVRVERGLEEGAFRVG